MHLTLFNISAVFCLSPSLPQFIWEIIRSSFQTHAQYQPLKPVIHCHFTPSFTNMTASRSEQSDQSTLSPVQHTVGFLPSNCLLPFSIIQSLLVTDPSFYTSTRDQTACCCCCCYCCCQPSSSSLIVSYPGWGSLKPQPGCPIGLALWVASSHSGQTSDISLVMRALQAFRSQQWPERNWASVVRTDRGSRLSSGEISDGEAPRTVWYKIRLGLYHCLLWRVHRQMTVLLQSGTASLCELLQCAFHIFSCGRLTGVTKVGSPVLLRHKFWMVFDQ